MQANSKQQTTENIHNNKVEEKRDLAQLNLSTLLETTKHRKGNKCSTM